MVVISVLRLIFFVLNIDHILYFLYVNCFRKIEKGGKIRVIPSSTYCQVFSLLEHFGPFHLSFPCLSLIVG